MSGGQLQILIVILFLGFSFVNWLIRQAKEQQAKQRVQQELERRRREALRTGRGMEGDAAREAWTQGQSFEDATPADNAADRREELARRRREQFERMRQRQQEQLASQQGAQSQRVRGPAPAPAARPVPTPPAAPVFRSGSIQRGGSGAVAMPKGGSASRQAASDLRTAQGIERRRIADLQPKAKKQKTILGKPVDATQITDRVKLSEIGAGGASGPRQRAEVMGEPITNASIRRAIIMNELLGTPMGMRPLSHEAPVEGR